MNSPIFDYTEPEVAALLGVTVRTLQRWRKAELIEHHRLPSGRIRYDASAVADFKARCRKPAIAKGG